MLGAPIRGSSVQVAARDAVNHGAGTGAGAREASMAATMLARLGASLSLILSGSSSGRMLKAGVLIGFGFYLHGLLGLLLPVAGIDLALSRQPFTPRPVCWSAPGFTVLVMLLVDVLYVFIDPRIRYGGD